MDVLLQILEIVPTLLKLRHWPSTALSFIFRLTNKKPVF